ncbi:MAG: hypothetical protein SGARI_002289 [Bacillariaceae sp.]
MGSLFSKTPPPAVKPRDENRVLAAADHIDGAAREALAKLDKTIQGKVLFAPKISPLGGTELSDAYHAQRERPFFYNAADYPSAIVMVETTDDVAAVVRTVKSLAKLSPEEEKKESSAEFRSYPLCIAAGCHSNMCMVEKSIVLDMSKFTGVQVDTDNKTVAVQGGAKIFMVHDALEGTGLGFMTDTGVSGLTLAGGAGWLGAQAGFACDTVLKAEVVLPSGEMVTATHENKYKDLMRAICGGGGNFGIVTEWTFKLFDVSNAMAGTVVHFAPTMWRLKYVLENYFKVMAEAPDAAGAALALPPGAPVCINLVSMIGDEVKGVTDYTQVPFFNKVSQLGAWFRVQNDIGPKDYIKEIAPILEPVQQRCFASVIGVMVYAVDEALIDALVHFARVDIPGKNSKPIIIVMNLFGKMSRIDGSKSSLRHRKAVAWVIIEAGYEPHATEEQIKNATDWADRAKAKLLEVGGEDGPHNFRDTDGRRIKFFTDEQRKFLQEAKEKYDPDNLLALNKNIQTKHID